MDGKVDNTLVAIGFASMYNYSNGCVIHILPGASIGEDKIVYHQQEQPRHQFNTLREPRWFGTTL